MAVVIAELFSPSFYNCYIRAHLLNIYPFLLGSWHDAGTYDAKTKTGGPDGSIRFMDELNHTANKGLKIAVDFCGELLLMSFFKC